MHTFTLASLRKGLYPWPVFEAHFTDGTVTRMSFWSDASKPLDVDMGKRASIKLTATRGKTYSHGFVEVGGKRAAENEAHMIHNVKTKSPAKVPANLVTILAEARRNLLALRCNDGALIDQIDALIGKAA